LELEVIQIEETMDNEEVNIEEINLEEPEEINMELEVEVKVDSNACLEEVIEALPDPSGWSDPQDDTPGLPGQARPDLNTRQKIVNQARHHELVAQLLVLQISTLQNYNLEPAFLCICGKYQHTGPNDSKSTEILNIVLKNKLSLAKNSLEIDSDAACCNCLTSNSERCDDLVLTSKVNRAPDPTLLVDPNLIKGPEQIAHEVQSQLTEKAFISQMKYESSSIFKKKSLKLYKDKTNNCKCCNLNSTMCSTLLTYEYGNYFCKFYSSAVKRVLIFLIFDSVLL
jgi:hypothetical protein